MREFLNKIKTFFMSPRDTLEKEKKVATDVKSFTINSDHSLRKDPDLTAQTLQGLGTGIVTTPPVVDSPVVEVVEQPVTQPEAAWPFPTTRPVERPVETITKKPRKPRAKKTTPNANV